MIRILRGPDTALAASGRPVDAVNRTPVDASLKRTLAGRRRMFGWHWLTAGLIPCHPTDALPALLTLVGAGLVGVCQTVGIAYAGSNPNTLGRSTETGILRPATACWISSRRCD
jgi:hypothetical protein